MTFLESSSSSPSKSSIILLGQYAVFGRVDVGVNDLYGEMLRFKDGFLYHNHDDSSIPLLASTEKLLNLLKHPGPDNELMDSLHQLKVTESIESEGVATEEAACQVDPAQLTDQNYDANKKEDDDAEEAADDDDDDAAEEDAAFQSFERIHNSCDLIVTVLTDIRNLKQRNYGADKTGARLSVDQRRAQVLEHQRDRLQKQLSSTDEQNDENGEDDDEEENGKEDPAVLFARGLNSLYLLTPILLNMLLHARRNDKNLKIQNKSIKPPKKDRVTKCWMIGEHTFDIASQKQCKVAYSVLRDVYLFLGLADLQHDNWQAPLVQAMQIVVKPQLGWVDSHPFANIQDKEMARLMDLTTVALDQKFGLLPNESTDKTKQQYQAAIRTLHQHVSKLLTHRFKGSRVSVYGSCLSDLSLGKAADVDLSLYIRDMDEDRQAFEDGRLSVKKYQEEVKRKVYQICRLLERRTHEFIHMTPVTRARVPVVKGTFLNARNPHHANGSLDFDVCFLNEIAVANSELLRQYSLIDPRVKQLMVRVKMFAKGHGISSAQDNCLSSYAWVNLVVFYLECLGFVPNLQCQELCKKVGVAADSSNFWHTVNRLDTFYLTWEQASNAWTLPESLQNMTVTALLYGFFEFYARRFPTGICIVSIKRGNECNLIKTAAFRRSGFFWSIEDPFETFDSHCPHDLGMPANEPGARKIVKCMLDAEEYLRKALLETKDITQIESLWPKPALAETNNGAKNQRNGGNRKKGGAAKNGGGTNALSKNEKNVGPNATNSDNKTKRSKNAKTDGSNGAKMAAAEHTVEGSEDSVQEAAPLGVCESGEHNDKEPKQEETVPMTDGVSLNKNRGRTHGRNQRELNELVEQTIPDLQKKEPAQAVIESEGPVKASETDQKKEQNGEQGKSSGTGKPSNRRNRNRRRHHKAAAKQSTTANGNVDE